MEDVQVISVYRVPRLGLRTSLQFQLQERGDGDGGGGGGQN